MQALATSYFANIKNLPDIFQPISISQGQPYWLKNIPKYIDLAPPWELIRSYKKGDVDDVGYTKIYIKDILDKLDPQKVMDDLNNISGDKIPCLMCYEKLGEFCHRHIGGQWLFDNSTINLYIKG